MVQEEVSFKDIRYLAAFLFSTAKPFVQFYRGYYEIQFCEFILNLEQGSGDVVKRYFLSRALAALLFGRVEPLVQF